MRKSFREGKLSMKISGVVASAGAQRASAVSPYCGVQTVNPSGVCGMSPSMGQPLSDEISPFNIPD